MASYPELSQITMTENDLNIAIIGEKWTYDDGTVWSVSDVLDSWPPVVVFKSSDSGTVVIDRTAFVTDLGWTKVVAPEVKPAPRSAELDHSMS